jgi:ABC-type uncharacterized transport system auxiliary subunit
VRICNIFLMVFVMMLAGCAGTAPKATFIQPPKENVKVDGNDTTSVIVTAGTGVEMLDSEKQRLTGVIEQKVTAKKALNGAGGESVAYSIDLTITRYEKGSAVARLISAGLGQIHIDSNVRLFRTDGHELLSEFIINKTFAWGGGYGAATRIEDIEPAFAEGIAAAITGQADSSANK